MSSKAQIHQHLSENHCTQKTITHVYTPHYPTYIHPILFLFPFFPSLSPRHERMLVIPIATNSCLLRADDVLEPDSLASSQPPEEWHGREICAIAPLFLDVLSQLVSVERDQAAQMRELRGAWLDGLGD